MPGVIVYPDSGTTTASSTSISELAAFFTVGLPNVQVKTLSLVYSTTSSTFTFPNVPLKVETSIIYVVV